VSSLLCRADERAKYTSGLNQMISPCPPLNSQTFLSPSTSQHNHREILLLPPGMNCLTRRARKPSQLGQCSDHAKGSITMASWLGLPAWKQTFLFSRKLRRGSGSLVFPALQPTVVVFSQPGSGLLASSFSRFLDHTQRRATVGRTSLDEWPIRRRDLYLTTHNTHNRQTSMPWVGFEPTISAGVRPQGPALWVSHPPI